MVEFRDLRNLVVVYEHRHFGLAAKKLGLSQPAISKSIQRMEKIFGFSLFDRSRSHVTPTAHCEALVSRAKLVLSGMADLDRTVRMLSGLEIGSLAVGVGPAMSESCVTRAIAWLAEQHPGIQIDVRVDHWRQLSAWLASGEIDLLVADLSDVEDDRRFLISKLPAEEFTWFCRRGHPLANGGEVSRGDLLKYPLATPRMPPWAIKWFQEVLDENDRDNAQVTLPTIRCENYSMLKRMVLDSNCISVALMDTIRSDVEEGRLVALQIHATTLKTSAGIVELRGRTRSPTATAFVRQVLRLAEAQR